MYYWSKFFCFTPLHYIVNLNIFNKDFSLFSIHTFPHTIKFGLLNITSKPKAIYFKVSMYDQSSSLSYKRTIWSFHHSALFNLFFSLSLTKETKGEDARFAPFGLWRHLVLVVWNQINWFRVYKLTVVHLS